MNGYPCQLEFLQSCIIIPDMYNIIIITTGSYRCNNCCDDPNRTVWQCMPWPCWLLPSNQNFYRQIADYGKGVGGHRVLANKIVAEPLLGSIQLCIPCTSIMLYQLFHEVLFGSCVYGPKIGMSGDIR